MVSVLSPSEASELATGVYSVNGGDSLALNIFLKNSIFDQSTNGLAQLKAEVGGRVLRATTDSFGVCAKGAGQYKNDLFLVFRGTTTANKKADFLTDARIGISISKTGQPVHSGFNQTFNSMLPDISSYIITAKSTGIIHCVGHSLGGAVASLAADWIAKNLPNSVRLYTFGAPRIGGELFVKSTTNKILSNNMFRVYHRTDPVPLVALYPYMQAPYKQNGYFIPSAEPLTSGVAHFMVKYVISVKNKTWKQLSGSPDRPYGVEAAIKNWLQSISPVSSSSPEFWRWLDSALIYVLKKVIIGGFRKLQGSFISFLTFADKIAYILAEGIELADSISTWVEHLIRKMMQALGMVVVKSKEKLTRALIKRVLIRIMAESRINAANALKGI